MKRSSALLPVLALALTTASAAAAPTSRSGASTSVAARGVAAPAASDRVFTNGLEPAPAGNAVTVYADRAAFLAAIAPGYVERDFGEVPAGPSPPLHYADGGFDFYVFTQLFSDNGLYDGAGYLSTDRVDDQIMVWTTLDDAPIGALGGNVWTSDFALLPTGGTIELTVVLQDGTIGATETVDSAGPEDFRGFVSAGAPIAYILIDAPEIDPPIPGTSPDRWPTLDNLVVGSAP